MSTWSEPQPDSRFVVVGGLRIHYKRAGGGPALVLLHGSAATVTFALAALTALILSH